MDHALYLKLVALLLKIPDIENPTTRTNLLSGLSNRASLMRNHNTSRTDISLLVDQLSTIYLDTGQWALSILIENALTHLEHTTTWKELEDHHRHLILSDNHTKNSASSAPPPTMKQPGTFAEKWSEKSLFREGDDLFALNTSKIDIYTVSNQRNKDRTSMEKIEIVVIAASQDDGYRRQVLTALEGILQFLERKEAVSVWHRGRIQPGSITAQEMRKHIQTARIILVLMSPDLLSNEFYSDPNNHMDMIIQRSKLDTVRVIPVLIRSSSWNYSPFKMLEPLPPDGIPLANSYNKDKTLQNIATSVLNFVEDMLAAYPVKTPSGLIMQNIQEELSMPASIFVHGHALLIGVGGDESLEVTVDDAQNFEKVLLHSARAAYPSSQIETLLASNATRVNILAAFDRLKERVSRDPDATVIVYFSGHGGKFSQDGQMTAYYLIPHGYDPFRRSETAIADHEFTTMIEAIQARKMIVLLDCCHAGAIPMLKDVGQRFTKSPLPPELLQALGSGSGRVVVASSLEGEKSQTNAQGSIFTNCLLEALRGKGNIHTDNAVRVLSVLAYLLKEVPLRTHNQQHPFINKILNMHEDFVLCYSQVQVKDVPDGMGGSAPFVVPTPLTTYLRARLEKRLEELESSLKRYDDKIALLNRAVDIETDPLRRFQYQQQLFDELAKRASIEEELKDIIRQLS